MKAVDTNFVLRLVLHDDERQYRQALAVANQGISIPLTVLLETAWVLASRFERDRARVHEALLLLLQAPGIYIADNEHVRVALDLFRAGADVADCLHLVAARGASAFVTFDRGMPPGDRLGVDVEIIA